jgi:PleD family two-component response regulator
MAGKKVLVVDDSLSSVLMQKLILQHERYEVVTATDGEAAVAAAIAEQPDLILMDVVMPGMNGFEASRKLRATPSTQHVPIIMTTTRHKLASLGKEAAAGDSEYLMKPIDRQELLAKVDRYLGN